MMKKRETYQHLKEVIAAEFSRRQNLNSRYSLRSFARDLGLSPGSLSDILKSKRNISRAKGKKIAEALRLNEIEKEFLVDLCEARHEGEKIERSQKIELLLLEKDLPLLQQEIERFKKEVQQKFLSKKPNYILTLELSTAI